MKIINTLISLHQRFFAALHRFTANWFLSLAARGVFAAVLLFYFWNSAWGKIGDGFFGFLVMQDGAYFATLGEAVMTAYDFDTANVPFYLDAVVYLGTWMEFLLPLLIILGLFTRLAALGMVGFVAVQSFVDIAIHKVDASAIGALFDRDSASVILDQRTLWMLLFLVLIVKGGGRFSVDTLLDRWWIGRSNV